MLWPHTKTLVPAEAGYEFFVETLKPPLAKQKVTVTTNSVPCIITPPLFGKTTASAKLQVRHTLKTKNCLLIFCFQTTSAYLANS